MYIDERSGFNGDRDCSFFHRYMSALQFNNPGNSKVFLQQSSIQGSLDGAVSNTDALRCILSDIVWYPIVCVYTAQWQYALIGLMITRRLLFLGPRLYLAQSVSYSSEALPDSLPTASLVDLLIVFQIVTWQSSWKWRASWRASRWASGFAVSFARFRGRFSGGSR